MHVDSDSDDTLNDADSRNTVVIAKQSSPAAIAGSWATLILSPEILVTALAGMGGTTFYFCNEFGFVTLGLSTTVPGEFVIVDIGSGIIATLMDLGYIGSLGPAVYANMRSAWRYLFSGHSPVYAELRDDAEEAFKLTSLQKSEYAAIAISSFLGLVVIGIGGFQGIMSISDAFDRHKQLTPGLANFFFNSALVSSIGMVSAFASFSIPRLNDFVHEIYKNNPGKSMLRILIDFLFIDSFKNIRAAWCSPPDRLSESRALLAAEAGEFQEALRQAHKNRVDASNRSSFDNATRALSANLAKFVAVGATVAFSAFKYYALDELLRKRYPQPEWVINTADCIGFSSLIVLTGLTTGVAIQKEFVNWSVRPDQPHEKRGIAWVIGMIHCNILALFMAIGAMMGVQKMLEVLPAIYGWITGVFTGICRYFDYMTFTAPGLMDTYQGKPMDYYNKAEMAEELEIIVAEGDAASSAPSRPRYAQERSLFGMFANRFGEGRSQSATRIGLPAAVRDGATSDPSTFAL